jgi:hypothetical protein
LTLPRSFILCNAILLQRFHAFVKGKGARLTPEQKTREKRFIISSLAVVLTLNVINFACCITAVVYNGRMFGPCSHRQLTPLTRHAPFADTACTETTAATSPPSTRAIYRN